MNKFNPGLQAMQLKNFMELLEKIITYCLQHQEEMEKRISALDGKTSEIPLPDIPAK